MNGSRIDISGQHLEFGSHWPISCKNQPDALTYLLRQLAIGLNQVHNTFFPNQSPHKKKILFWQNEFVARASSFCPGFSAHLREAADIDRIAGYEYILTRHTHLVKVILGRSSRDHKCRAVPEEELLQRFHHKMTGAAISGRAFRPKQKRHAITSSPSHCLPG